MIQIPDAFICPLTLECMETPMMSRSGHSFERSAIIAWVQENGTHPLTREPMTLRGLISNSSLQEQIRGWKLVHQGAVYSSDTDACSEDDNDSSLEEGPVICVSQSEMDQFERRENELMKARGSKNQSPAQEENKKTGRRRFLRLGRRQKVWMTCLKNLSP